MTGNDLMDLGIAVIAIVALLKIGSYGSETARTTPIIQKRLRIENAPGAKAEVAYQNGMSWIAWIIVAVVILGILGVIPMASMGR